MSFFSLALYGGIALGPVLGETVLEARSFDAVWIVAAMLSWAAALPQRPGRCTPCGICGSCASHPGSPTL